MQHGYGFQNFNSLLQIIEWFIWWIIQIRRCAQLWKDYFIKEKNDPTSDPFWMQICFSHLSENHTPDTMHCIPYLIGSENNGTGSLSFKTEWKKMF